MDLYLYFKAFTRKSLDPFGGNGKEFGVIGFLRITVFGKAWSNNIGQGCCDPVARWIPILLNEHNVIRVKAGHVGQLFLLQSDNDAFLLLTHDCYHHPVPKLAIGIMSQPTVLFGIHMDNLRKIVNIVPEEI